MDKVLITRSLTGLAFAFIMLILLYLGKIGYICISLAIIIVGSYEYNTIFKKNLTPIIICLIPCLLLWLSTLLGLLSDEVKIILLGFTLFLHLLYITNVLSPWKIRHERYLPYVAIAYPTLAVCLPLMFENELIWQRKFWFYAFILIWASDTGAYLIGRKIGKHKLIPSVSPGKTVEGFLGAGVFTTMIAILLYYTTDQKDMVYWILFALVVWVIGTLGDLYESTIKRQAGVKDSGAIMPGHGGILDRFDSFIFVAPFLVVLLFLLK